MLGNRAMAVTIQLSAASDALRGPPPSGSNVINLAVRGTSPPLRGTSPPRGGSNARNILQWRVFSETGSAAPVDLADRPPCAGVAKP